MWLESFLLRYHWNAFLLLNPRLKVPVLPLMWSRCESPKLMLPFLVLGDVHTCLSQSLFQRIYDWNRPDKARMKSSFPEASFKLVWTQRNLHSKTLLLLRCCGQRREYTQAPATTDLIIWQQEDMWSTGFFYLLWGCSIRNTGLSSNVCSPGSVPWYQVGPEMQGVSGRRWESRSVESPKQKD